MAPPAVALPQFERHVELRLGDHIQLGQCLAEFGHRNRALLVEHLVQLLGRGHVMLSAKRPELLVPKPLLRLEILLCLGGGRDFLFGQGLSTQLADLLTLDRTHRNESPDYGIGVGKVVQEQPGVLHFKADGVCFQCVAIHKSHSDRLFVRQLGNLSALHGLTSIRSWPLHQRSGQPHLLDVSKLNIEGAWSFPRHKLRHAMRRQKTDQRTLKFLPAQK
jgi:hypothetical protein